ncbi:RHS repeat-associated core domain-containing protein [Kitasatospora putterlickiae]|uniref:RHS repeat-associated core domain-containing protein n=1 Tax=Kitasatospora putterlickiae TaxID=221725 RepID=UPI0031D1D048
MVLPDWADKLLDLIGVSWPNVDEDDYRRMADAMRAFADDVEDGTATAHQGIQALVASSGGSRATAALDAHWGMVRGEHLKSLAECGRLAATALDGVAVVIEGAKAAALVQLDILAVEVAAAQAAAPFTLGLSELGALGAAGATRAVLRRLFKEAARYAAEQVVGMALAPVEQALGAMAGDLVVQLGENAVGSRQGIDLGQTARVGRSGQDAGGEGTEGQLTLASAGGGGAGAGGSFTFDPGEYDRAAVSLTSAGGVFRDRAGGRITSARSHHGRTRGKDAIADAANAVLDKVINGIETGLKKTAGHLDQSMTRGLRQMATNHRNNDRSLADHIGGLHKPGAPNTVGPGAGGVVRPATTRTGTPGGNVSTPLRAGASGGGAGSARPASGRCTGGDPIDLISGEMLLTEVDVELPGLLPLVVARTHLSSYRCGQWFGRSWASTIDQRLEADGNGLVLATDDGMLLVYPVPLPNEPVLPDHGPRLPLTWDGTPGGEITVTDPATGRILHFAPVPAPVPGTAAASRTTLPLTRVSDRNGHRLEIDRTADGTPVAIRHSGGYRIAVDTADGRITALRLLDRVDNVPHDTGGTAGVVLRRYGYDWHGNLAEVVDALGHPARFGYDAEDRVIERTDRNGSRYRWEYDGTGRCVRGAGPDGFLSCTVAYDPTARVNLYTNSLGHTTAYHYDEHWQLAGWTDAAGYTVHRLWAGPERLIAATDALGRTTRYAYDDAGNTVSVVRADGHELRATYNDLGLPVEIVEEDGGTWRYTYDDRGNRLSSTDPLGSVTHYTYDAQGHPTAITDALGHTRHITTDAFGLPLGLSDALGHTTSVERDALGRVKALIGADGRVERFGWTPAGRPAWHERPDGTTATWEWDPEDNLVAATDPAGNISRFTFTHFHLPTSRTDPDGLRHVFRHNTELRLAGVTGPDDHTWQYTYDAVGRLIRETDFTGRTIAYRLDPTGALTARTNGAGETTTYIRDVLGRPVAEHSPEGVSTFTYDLAGCLLRSTNAATTVEHTYDLLGRKLTETINGRTTTWTYDAIGRRTERRTPSGTISAWSYDPAGRPTALSTGGHQTDFTFDATGREILRTLGPDLTLRHDWDANGRLSAQHISHRSDLLQQRNYAYRPDGFLSGIRDLTGGSRRFELTSGGQITAVHGTRWSESYAYDPTGNLVRAAHPAADPSTPVHHYDGRQLRRSGRTSYEYDANGRLIRRHTRLLDGRTRSSTYTWSSDDRLTSTTTPDGTRWTYTYDAAGRRTAKRRLDASGRIAEETTFSWDGTRLSEQTTSTGATTTWDYHCGTHRPLTQLYRRPGTDPSFHHIVTDLSGAPAELVAPDGTVTRRAPSTVWGLPLPESTDDPDTQGGVETARNADCPLRFPGQYADEETGWYYNYFRYYDPQTAQYLSHDPLGLATAPNDYAYVTNPFTIADPLGLMPSINGPGGRWMRDPNTPVINHNRDTEYPGSYRQPTHDAMATQWTEEGVAQRGVPVYPAGHPSAGSRIPRDQLNWFDSNGNPIPSDQLTYEHLHPVVEHWNQTGYNSDRATRNDYYNDTNNMVPMTRSQNSSGGGRMTATYRQDTGPNYNCS